MKKGFFLQLLRVAIFAFVIFASAAQGFAEDAHPRSATSTLRDKILQILNAGDLRDQDYLEKLFDVQFCNPVLTDIPHMDLDNGGYIRIERHSDPRTPFGAPGYPLGQQPRWPGYYITYVVEVPERQMPQWHPLSAGISIGDTDKESCVSLNDIRPLFTGVTKAPPGYGTTDYEFKKTDARGAIDVLVEQGNDAACATWVSIGFNYASASNQKN